MIPKSFNDFTVEQFMKWDEIVSSPEYLSSTSEAKDCMLMGLLLNKTAKEISELSQAEWLIMATELDLLQFTKPTEKIKRVIKLNGKYYIPVLDARVLKRLQEDALSTVQYTAFKELTREGKVKNLNRLLPLFYTPFRLFRKPKLSEDQNYLAEQFLKAKIGDVYGAVFFYTKLYKNLTAASLPYFQSATQTIQNHMNEVYSDLGVDSPKPMDGTL